jgi:hypothetical protein
MKKLLASHFPVVLIQLLFGCAPLYYSPNAHNVPLLTHKGETTVNLAVSEGMDGVDEGIDLQAATAVTNHFGVLGNFYRAWGSSTHGSGSGTFFETAGGYYTPIPTRFARAIEGKFVASAFTGGGVGSVTNYDDADKTAFSKKGFNRIFIQPGFGFKSTYLDAVISLRLANLHYHSVEEQADSPIYNYPNLVSHYHYHARAADIIRRKPSYFLLEPALTLRAGWQYIKFQLQVGASTNLTDRDFPQENQNLNLGLYFDLFPVENWLSSRKKE